MAFRKHLLAIDQELGSEDVEAFKFLCSDFIGTKKLREVHSAQRIFQLLMDEDLLSEEDHFLVIELLYIIRQYSLLRKFNWTKEDVQSLLCTKGRVSAYRQMLYELSENITSDVRNSIFFLLMDHLPRKQGNNMSTLELLTFLEKRDFFSQNNLQNLEEVFARISPDLVKKITKYKLEQVSASVPCQETTLHKPSISDMQEPQEISSQFLSFTAHGNKSENITTSIVDLSLDNSSQAITDLPCYKMNRQSRGRCLIINNINFDTQRDRKGSQKDADDLKNVFTWLELEVEIVVNLKAMEILKTVENYGQMNYTNHDCFVCCILSHGESGQIIGTDGNIVAIRKVTTCFTALKCPSLADKPKLFFIQACQGSEIQQGFHIDVDAIDPRHSEHRAVSLSESIPHDADFLLGMATVDGFYCFRDVKEGTWFIQALCKNLRKLVPRHQDILSILTKVNEDVSRKSDKLGKLKQMPQPAYTLRKRLIFPVPDASLEYQKP